MGQHTPRLGEILAANGLVTRDQVDRVLERQRTDGRPFGVLCEEMLGLDPAFVEAAWVDQYKRLVSNVEADFARADPFATQLVSARQAWQFRIVPIRFDEGVLVAATTSEHLPRAQRFCQGVLNRTALFVVVDAEELADALASLYPIGGLDARHVRGGMLTLEKLATDSSDAANAA